uniref:ARF like GTPase 16 n=2 Tax=Podarcis muralis TaxID=64176 RepID=A0A670I4Z9_PODMU
MDHYNSINEKRRTCPGKRGHMATPLQSSLLGVEGNPCTCLGSVLCCTEPFSIPIPPLSLTVSAQLSSKDGAKDLGEPPATLPTVGTNLTDLQIRKKITIRELGGCMGPIWSSYYSDCCCVLYMIDAAKPTQISSSCIQLLSLLSAEQLASVPVLIIFNKIDLPCYMSLVEMKSLFRIQDIIACAKQPITVVETSARDGNGLSNVMQWFHSTTQCD